MKLPSDSDYQATLQHPREAFEDVHLRDGVPELGTGGLAGLPRPRAGNFATVYKLQCGERAFAVRCFTRAIQLDQQLRYVEIVRHLALHRLACAVDVAFLQRGIQVHGEWYPIVKMEWVRGESLSRFVEQHRASPRALFELATQWLELLAALRGAGVAHGDLQHGNVLITPEGLRLVDYDGMFVPALAGRRGHERGHANYQHPLRDDAFFDERLDHFPAWVVWTSLVALAHEPSLWERFHGGDDCLLFRQRDFAAPEGSALFQALLTSPHERVKAAASFLRSLLSLPPAQVPALDEQALASRSLFPASRTADAGFGEAVPERREALPFPKPELLRFIGPTPEASRGWSAPSLAERQLAGGLVLAGCASAVMTVALSPFWLMGLGLAGGAGLAWARAAYLRQEPVKRRQACVAWVEKATRELEQAEAQVRQLQEERARLEAAAHARSAKPRAELESLTVHVRETLRRLLNDGPEGLDRLLARRRRLDEAERSAREAMEAEHRSAHEDLTQRVAAHTSAETAIADALRRRQRNHVMEALRKTRLAEAAIPGIEPRLKKTLQKAGILNAADVTREGLASVPRLGSQFRKALLQWRVNEEARAYGDVPLRLSWNEEQRLRSSWREQWAEMKAKLTAARQQLEEQLEALSARFARERKHLDVEEAAAREKLTHAEAGLYRELADPVHRLARELRGEYRDVDALEVKLAAARRERAARHWTREEAARELAAHDAVRFTRYLGVLLHDGQEPP